MKRNGLKRIALAVCACSFAAGTALAQSSDGLHSTNSVQSSLSSSSGYAIGHDRVGMDGLSSSASSLSEISVEGETLRSVSLSQSEIGPGTLSVTRFGVRDGQLVAYGRLLPSSSVELNAGETGGAVYNGVLLSTPIEPAGGYGSSPSLGAGSRIAIVDIIDVSPSASVGSSTGSSLWAGTSRPSWSGVSVDEPFDDSRLGSWTGIGTGYGESGVESRSNMTSDPDDGTMSLNLGRPYDDVSYMEDVSGSSDLELSTDPFLESEVWVTREPWVSSSTLSASSSSSLSSSSMSVSADVPLVSLGTSSGLYASREAERAALVMAGDDVAVPVSVVSASCDAVVLSFGGAATGGSETITITSLSGSDGERLESTLCDVAAASYEDNRNAALLKHLNRLVSRTQ